MAVAVPSVRCLAWLRVVLLGAALMPPSACAGPAAPGEPAPRAAEASARPGTPHPAAADASVASSSPISAAADASVASGSPILAAPGASPGVPRPSPAAVAVSAAYLRLIEAFSGATVEPRLPAAGEVERIGQGRNLPCLYSALPPDRRPFHRKVLARRADWARTDVREALLLPVGTTVRYAVELRAHSRLLLWAQPVTVGGAEVPVTVRAEVTRAGEPALGYSATLDAVRLPAVPSWPAFSEVDLAALSPGPAELTLTAVPASGRPDRALWVVWGDPRLEAPLPVAPAAGAPGAYDNVLLLLVDALRCDATGPRRAYATTVAPHFDGLATAGVTFDETFANADTTLLGTNQILSGQHARGGGYLVLRPRGGPDNRARFYARRPPMLSRLLREAGLLTGLIAHNHLFFQTYEVGLDPGFDVYADYRLGENDDTLMADEAIRWLEQHAQRRFFLTVFLIAPHTPYQPSPAHLERASAALQGADTFLQPKYLGEVAYADEQAGRILATLDRLGLSGRTLVVFTADHGEVMDPAHAAHSERAARGSLYSHGLTLYDEEICVPIVFRRPGALPAGVVLPGTVQHVDIAPTVLEWLGLPADPRMTGVSQVAALRGTAPPLRRAVFAEQGFSAALRVDGYKYITHGPRDDICTRAAAPNCREEIFALQTDPREHRNLVAVDRAARERLRAAYREARQALQQHERTRLGATP